MLKSTKETIIAKSLTFKSVTSNVPAGKRAVGWRVSMEFFNDDNQPQRKVVNSGGLIS